MGIKYIWNEDAVSESMFVFVSHPVRHDVAYREVNRFEYLRPRQSRNSHQHPVECLQLNTGW